MRSWKTPELSRPTSVDDQVTGPNHGAHDIVLDLVDVSVYYGHVLALNDVSIRIRAGQFVCLLGGNASGKSTTMKTILGLVRPRRGELLLKGEDISRRSTSAIIRRGVALVPENRELFPSLSVEENLILGAYTRRRHGSGVDESLEEVYQLFPRVKERRRQRSGTLSGGEQQMVAMGRALMSSPEVILMDEPSMGLSPAMVKQSFELLASVHAMGKSILVVEQNADAALAIADYGYVLQAGQLVLEGPANELREHSGLRAAYLS